MRSVLVLSLFRVFSKISMYISRLEFVINYFGLLHIFLKGSLVILLLNTGLDFFRYLQPADVPVLLLNNTNDCGRLTEQSKLEVKRDCPTSVR